MTKNYVCPKCGSTDEVYIRGENKLRCEACGHNFFMDNKTKKQRKKNIEGDKD